MRKHIISLITVFIILYSMSAITFAQDMLSMSEKGSIEITMNYEQTIVTSGAITLYKVGAIHEDSGNYSYLLTGDFISYEQPLDNIQSPELAESLSDYAADKTFIGITKEIDQNGKVKFSDLDLGLYLLVQSTISEGYNKVAPFLVSVPMIENGNYIYNVDASPKVELKKESSFIASIVRPSDTILPQTGQLNWPIPILVITGLGLFAVGWVIRFGCKQENYEK